MRYASRAGRQTLIPLCCRNVPSARSDMITQIAGITGRVILAIR